MLDMVVEGGGGGHVHGRGGGLVCKTVLLMKHP
jgi:hypothetical protein